MGGSHFHQLCSQILAHPYLIQSIAINMSLLLIKHLELFLVAATLILFLAKLLTVANYQQRTGDYFTNKIIFSYRLNDFTNGCDLRRRNVIIRANVYNTAFWACIIALLLLTMMEKQHLF